MSYLSGNAQPRCNQHTDPDAVQNHFHSCTYTSSTPCPWALFPRANSLRVSCRLMRSHAHHASIDSYVCLDLPSLPSVDERRYLTEGFETAQTYPPLWVANMSCYGGLRPGGIGSSVSFPFGDTHANIPREGRLEFPGSITSDQPFNITTNESSPIPPIPTTAVQTPSTTSTTPVPPQVQPALPVHKYQCTTCLRRFDRESRLENCQNRHSGIKPHRCLGACGTVEWYVTPRSILPPWHPRVCLTDYSVR
jgi:hypothetical protein